MTNNFKWENMEVREPERLSFPSEKFKTCGDGLYLFRKSTDVKGEPYFTYQGTILEDSCKSKQWWEFWK